MRRFLADASHELRTPLASIAGYAELMNRGTDRIEPGLAWRRVTAESARMTGLVEDLLLLARLDEAARCSPPRWTSRPSSPRRCGTRARRAPATSGSSNCRSTPPLW
ncbi:histidine kinase dimerization/phospho-acceptor domain-containing protein [Streptomyces sp. L7]